MGKIPAKRLIRMEISVLGVLQVEYWNFTDQIASFGNRAVEFLG